MDKQGIEKLLKERYFFFSEKQVEDLADFMSKEIIPEVLKSVCSYNDEFFKNYQDGVSEGDAALYHFMTQEAQKAKELYNIDLTK